MMKLTDVKCLSGDIGLNTSDAFMSKGIRFFSSLQTKKATKSHAWACVGYSEVVEATNKIRLNLLSKYEKPIFKNVVVYRLPLSKEDRQSLRIGLLRRINKAYGWLKLPLFALDALSTKIWSLFGRKTPVFFWTSTFGISNIPVCSQLVVYALHKFTSYLLRDENGKQVNWKIVSPDYLEDLLKIHHNGAYKIYSKKE